MQPPMADGQQRAASDAPDSAEEQQRRGTLSIFFGGARQAHPLCRCVSSVSCLRQWFYIPLALRRFELGMATVRRKTAVLPIGCA